VRKQGAYSAFRVLHRWLLAPRRNVRLLKNWAIHTDILAEIGIFLGRHISFLIRVKIKAKLTSLFVLQTAVFSAFVLALAAR
jgi:hypothetical protein